MEFAAAQDESTEIGEEDIVEHIFEAVIEQRLPPGTKLSESALCDAFGVGRMRIRRALLLLASRQIVDLQANRGAFVASPTAEQAHEVFEARLMLEPSITRLAVQRATDAEIAMLAAHIEREHEAHHIGRRRDAIRLSGQFHGLLAQVAGNSVMLRMLARDVVKKGQIVSIFKSQTFPTTGYGYVYNLKPELAAKVKDAFFSFKWEGTDLLKEFEASEPPQQKFMSITYKRHRQVVRDIDNAMGVKYDCKG